MAEGKISQQELVAQWEAVQIKTFTKWVNSHLAKRAIAIDNIRTAFTDGVNLIHLLEIISDETLPKKNLHPKMKIHKVENVGTVHPPPLVVAFGGLPDRLSAPPSIWLPQAGPSSSSPNTTSSWPPSVPTRSSTATSSAFLPLACRRPGGRHHSLTVILIIPHLFLAVAEDRLTLGMLWTIILRFAIAGLSEEGMSAKQGLLLWCQRKTEPYNNVEVKDFSASFHDGLAFCALIHRHRPVRWRRHRLSSSSSSSSPSSPSSLVARRWCSQDLIPYEQLTSEDPLANLNVAFDTALRHLGVPRILDAEDIASMPRPDERSVMTYVAQLYNVFASMDKVEHAGRRLGKVRALLRSSLPLRPGG